MPRKRWSALGASAVKRKGWPTGSRFALGDACATGLPGGAADFVWGEDAWCYVVDKDRLIGEAARLVKAGGTIAFTDWIEGRGAADRRRGASGSSRS